MCLIGGTLRSPESNTWGGGGGGGGWCGWGEFLRGDEIGVIGKSQFLPTW